MLVKGYVHQVVIICGSEVIARHERSYERESAVFDPLHYLRLLEHKSRALEQAAPLAGWPLPDCAIEDALRMNTISFDAVRLLVLCRIERRPPRLDLQNWPHLPLPRVRTTAAADYMTLLAATPTSPTPSNMEVV